MPNNPTNAIEAFAPSRKATTTIKTKTIAEIILSDVF